MLPLFLSLFLLLLILIFLQQVAKVHKHTDLYIKITLPSFEYNRCWLLLRAAQCYRIFRHEQCHEQCTHHDYMGDSFNYPIRGVRHRKGSSHCSTEEELLHRRTVRWSFCMTDTAEGITGRISHVIMIGALLMALFMAEDMITLCHASQRLYLKEGRVIFIYKPLCLCSLVTWRRELKLSRKRRRERRRRSSKRPKI